MRAAKILVVAILLVPAAAGQLAITPTTTLTKETGNNTSAANSFTTQVNGNLGASNISKMPIRSLLYPGATTKIYAHFMPWFGGSNHMWVGYRSDDPAQVKRQVSDMLSRGIAGAIVDWYGPNFARENNTTIYLMREAETRSGFEFAIMEDAGALRKCASTAGCDVTQRLINDLNYAANTFYGSPAYMRRDGRPVVFFFGVDAYPIDWNRARAGVSGNPLFIFRNAGAFTHAQSNGGFSWVGINRSDPNNPGTGHLDGFYSTALKYPNKKAFGSGYAGFNDVLAAWAPDPPRVVNRNCGATWLATMAEAGKYYSSANQLREFQIVTWNDYEEGTEVESGIDNCVRVSAAVSGKILSWGISGDARTVDHFRVFISTDGESLMLLKKVGVGTRSLDLGGFNLAAGTYRLYVQAYGRASLKNQMSGAVTYTLSAGRVIIEQPVLASMPYPLQVAAKAESSNPVTVMQVYIDGLKQYESASSSIAVSVPSAKVGTRRLTVQARDSAGNVLKTTRYVEVAPSVTIQNPAAGTTVSSPMRVVASANTATPIAVMQVYIDGLKKYEVRGVTRIDKYLSAAAGTRRVTVQSLDANGQVVKATVYVIVR